DGQFKKSALEAVSYASELAGKGNVQCIAVSVGNADDSKLSELVRYGADKIISVKSEQLSAFSASPYAKAIAHAAAAEQATVVVISNTYTGKSVAARVAAKLKAGIVSGVISYPNTSSG